MAATSSLTVSRRSSRSSRMCSRVGSPRTRKKRAAADRLVGATSPEYISGKQDIITVVPIFGRLTHLGENSGYQKNNAGTSADVAEQRLGGNSGSHASPGRDRSACRHGRPPAS